MSLFLKIAQPFSSPRIIRVRAYECTVGVDDIGILSLDPVGRALFKLQRDSQGVFLFTLVDSLVVNEARIDKGIRRALSTADLIKVGEAQISVHLASDYAESLAALPLSLSGYVAAINQSATLRQLSFSFLNLRREIPVLPGVEYSLGSGADDSVQIELAGIVRKHGVMRVDNGTVTITPKCGDIAYNSRLLTAPVNTKNPATFYLSPSGLPINVR